MYGETVLGCDFFLAGFDGGVEEFLDVPALHANDMIVMFAVIEFEHRFVAFKVMPDQDTRQLELGQHAINRRQADIFTAGQKLLVHFFRAQVPIIAIFKKIQNLEAWQRDFKAGFMEILGCLHGVFESFGVGDDTCVQA